MTGIAAILRFPVPGLDDSSSEEEEAEGDSIDDSIDSEDSE